MLIGMTGGIGSGKSMVAKFIKKKGFPVYNSDEWAKFLVEKSLEIQHEIALEFGEKAYLNGTYNRAYISEIVFKQPEKLQLLNAIIHPRVAQHFELWKNQQTQPFIFKETALLFELQLHLQCNKSLLVTAATDIRIQRVMKRDGKTYEQVLNIIEKQMPENEKINRADFVIFNNGNLENLEKETTSLMNKLSKINHYL